jgi:amidase
MIVGIRMSRREALTVIGGSVVSATGARAFAQGADWHWFTIDEIARLIAARKILSTDLTARMLDRIRSVDKTLHSYATLMAEAAMAAAASADREIASGKNRGPLHGVPVAVKDLCHTRGVRTMGGAFVTRDFVPDEDGTIVTKLRDAGAIVLGKLNLTEGAMGGYHPEMGIPLNPWDTSRWPGVSSSGSGAATAAGLCFAAIGTDTGGSIRFPSSANGIVGLKPTYGRVSRHGVLALSPQLDHVGPMARSVTDVAIVYDAIAGHDPKDSTSLTDRPASARAALGRPIKGMRIGIDRDYAMKGIDAGQVASIEEALKVLAGLGAIIVDVKMPDRTEMLNSWVAICATEAVAAHRANFPSRANDYGPYFRQFLSIGASMPAEQLAKANAWRVEFNARFTALLESVDAMACQAGGAPAWPVTRALQTGPFLEFAAAWDKASPRASDFTMPMNLAGTPAICLPSGFSVDGLPYSIQFAGRRLSEPALCQIAHAFERATTWNSRHPRV